MTAGGDRDRLGILVHEVRSPVAALSAIAKTYPDPGLDADARRSLAELAVGACRAIERVVADASVESVRPEEIDVGRVVGETVAAWTLAGANVRAEVALGIPRLQADPIRLRQALDNLVSNAVVHSPPHTEIVVDVRQRDREILISVVDSGPGVPLDEQERIFDAGVRLDAARPGFGIGLSVSRAIVEAHGGRLTVASTVGEGATFTLALPFPARL